MNGHGRSSFYGRCQIFQEREATVHVTKKRSATGRNLWILAGVMIVSTFCGTLFWLRLAGLSGKDVEPNSESRSENRPLPGSLESAQCSPVCYTKGCIRTAADILEMQDLEVSPCEDFYRYACGRFKRELSEHKTKEQYLWSVEHEAIKFFQDLLKEIPQSVLNNTFGFPLIKLRKFYDSCIDPRSSNGNTFPTAFKYLEFFGIKQWPHLNHNYKFSNPDLDEVFTRMFFYDLHQLFKMHPEYLVPQDGTGWPAPNFEFSAEKMHMKMVPSNTPIFHSEGITEADKTKLINEILESFVPNNTIRDKIATEIFAFSLALSDVSQRTKERIEQCRTNKTINCDTAFRYNCTQRGNQKKDRWCRIGKKILERSGLLKKLPTLSLQLEDGEHFQELAELIDSTDPRIIAHTLAVQFFVAKVASENFGLRSKNKLQDKAPLLKKIFYEKIEDRSTFCATWAFYRLHELAEMAFYYIKYHDSNLRKEVNEIYEDIKDISYSTVRNISWIDAEVKDSLEELFSKIEFSPENFLQLVNTSGVIELYQKVRITEESFLANDLESQKLKITLGLRNKVTPERKYETNYPFEFNPRYSFFSGMTYFGLANFLFPVIALDRPRSANLGTLGFVIGHELSHAIEFHIRAHNKSEAFENALRERQKCLQDQFFKHEVFCTGTMVDGNRTYAENLADFLGIRAAFKSLKKYQEKHGDGEVLPGIRFNNEKQFFLMVAQTFCEESSKESQEAYFVDTHSPPNARINGMFTNFDAFSRAFGCASGSPMNPVIKCSFE